MAFPVGLLDFNLLYLTYNLASKLGEHSSRVIFVQELDVVIHEM